MKDTLSHFGILGMHWGVRRPRGANGLVKKGAFDNESPDSKKAKELRKKGAKNLSNAELKEYVERRNLETQYAKLSKKEVSAGKKFVQDVLVTAGKQTLTAFATKQMTNALDKAVKK